MTTTINHSRKAIPIIAALLLTVGAANATVYTDSWTEGSQPSSSHNGFITYTYHSAGGIQKMAVNPPADGDEFVFTGGKISFMNQSANASVTASKACKVVFQNDAWIRNFTMTAPAAPAPVTNHFRRAFIGTDYVTLLANANLDDYEPVAIMQDWKDENGREIDQTSGQQWLNRAQTLFPHCLVREEGKLSFQYQTGYTDKDGRKIVKVIKMEMKQVGADIKIRATGAYSVYSDVSAPLNHGFDVDALWDELVNPSDKVEESLYTDGDSIGYGVNTVALKYIGSTFTMRFEGTGTQHINGAKPGARARIELSDVTKLEKASYPGPTGGTIAFMDGSYDDFRWYINAGNKSATGTFIFETTKPTSDPSAVNTISLSSMEWMGATPFVVKGIENNPMLLNVTAQKNLPTNSTVTAKYGGIVRLASGGVKGLGVRGGSCGFIAERGGILQQAASHVFGTKARVEINSGQLMLEGIGSSNTDLGTDLPLLTLRNGARIDPANAVYGKPLRIGQTASGVMWNVGGYAPSTNNVLIQFMGPGNFAIVTNVFNIAKTGDYDADFVCNRPINYYPGGDQYRTNVLRKVGFGTIRLNGTYSVPGRALIEGGTIKLGNSNCWGGAGFVPPITLCGGGLAAVAGTSNTFGEMTLSADSRLTVEEGATMAFADLSSVAWAPGAQLDITIPTDAERQLLGTVKFGNSRSGLTQSQIDAIRLNGKEAVLAADGHVTFRHSGLVFIVK